MQAEHTLSLLHIGQWGQKGCGDVPPRAALECQCPPVASITYREVRLVPIPPILATRLPPWHCHYGLSGRMKKTSGPHYPQYDMRPYTHNVNAIQPWENQNDECVLIRAKLQKNQHKTHSKWKLILISITFLWYLCILFNFFCNFAL